MSPALPSMPTPLPPGPRGDSVLFRKVIPQTRLTVLEGTPMDDNRNSVTDLFCS